MNRRVSYTFQDVVKIPPSINPNNIIQFLHQHSDVTRLHPLVEKVDHVPTADPPREYFQTSDDQSPIEAYDVSKPYVIIPGIGKWGQMPLKYRAYFKDTHDGVVAVTIASGGVSVKRQWVVKRDSADEGEGNVAQQDEGSAQSSQGDWVLTENTTIESSRWLMPFVKYGVATSHTSLCADLIKHEGTVKRD